MKVVKVEKYEEVCEHASEMVLTAWKQHPQLVLGLATGSTPIGFYRRLVERYLQERLDFSGITTFNLDEYYPIKRSHPQSFARFMKEHFFDHVNIPAEQIHILNGEALDTGEECSRFEAGIDAAGGVDIQILGIGRNGHIGFNEPGTPFGSRSHLVALTASTIQANSRFFADPSEMPRHALTMGIQTIMKSKKILLLAVGEGKAEAIRLALQGPVTEAMPASILKRHPDVTLILDRGAASLLGGGVQDAAARDSQ
ncbi:glucosamine-6-phosphate deaminase [Brevibacillus sp. H7]|uniref:glucosamine-6-phosphate deaminase n=1 Tax=Brevibacillus sp. H7 TaxID=3349138 RepID=UPI00382F9ABC